MSIALLVKTLLDAGVDHATIVAAVEAVERPVVDEQAERRRAADRERKRTKILRNSAESAEDLETPSPEVFPHTPFPNPNPVNPSKKNPKGFQKGSPSQAFSEVLRPDVAQAVVEHRQRIRKPLTARAAELLAGKFGACADPNAAAEAMIANGWQGFEPEWLERQQPRGQPPPKQKYTYVDAMNEILEEMGHERQKSEISHGNVERLAFHERRTETEADDVFGSGG